MTDEEIKSCVDDIQIQEIKDRLYRYKAEHGEWPKPGTVALYALDWLRDQDARQEDDTMTSNPVVQAAEIIEEHGAELRTDAIRERLTRHYLEHGEWPQAGGLAVDVAAYVRAQDDDEGGSWDTGSWDD